LEDRINYPEIVYFLRNTIKRETGYLKELEDFALKNHIPIIQPESAAFIKTLVMLKRPQRILEVGTAIGYSATIMLEAMDKSGIIDTIEIDEQIAEIAKRNIKKMGYDNRIRVIIGDASEVLECINSPYDLIFLDAAKGQYCEYLEHAVRLLRPEGLLLSDNVLYKGGVVQGENAPHKHRTIAVNLKKYLYEICHDESLETSVIPIGDGMAISLKKGELDEKD
jgi:predicted O-methyltransferase YrrM